MKSWTAGNEELTAMNEELIASEEELRSQFSLLQEKELPYRSPKPTAVSAA